ncbi:hypothetical protein [Stenotrophomonas indicatrix]|uniref:hypothetical protein n=1 Tax=Stenotrophomonas indicatrix TaxID=2045451 RepID=UPI0008AF0AF9|nr:hypothetical protein [Stenotrophomonas indicatrix]SET91112.1 hypothetical protein SAMN05720615_109201 [Stenotrophomonas indicatrix]SEU12931.1 hypothetical protein SAMN05720615_11847 [Stenotrophomonas indicatrix]
MLTMFKRLASLVPTPASSKVTLFVSDTGIPSYKDDAGLVTPMSGQPIPAGYIDGLKMEYVAPGQMRFTSGSAYIPSLGRALALPSALTKTLTLSANAWYHNFLYSNSGVADVETVTTLPDTPYSGTARTKTGDTSRRYIGSFRTDASGAIYKFRQTGNQITYLVSTELTPFAVFSGTVPVSPATTSVSASAIVPLTSTSALMMNLNASTNAFLLITNSEGPAVPGFIVFVAPNSTMAMTAPLAADQSMICSYQSSGTSLTAVLRVYGYTYER